MADYTESKKAKATEVTSFSPTIMPEDIENAPETYVPEGFDDLESYLQDMRENYELDLQADYDNREAALDDKKFVAGEQWDPMVLEQRKGLPCLIINSIPQFTAQLVGDWRTNRIGVKVIPAEDGDKDVASIRSDLIRAIEVKSRAPRVYDTAFESMIQCGDGAFRVGVRYANEDVFDQEIYIGGIDDCLSTVWDRMSIDPTGRDAVRCYVDDLMPEKEFKARWKDADPSTLNDKEQGVMSAQGWVENGAVRVTEHWRMIERKKKLVLYEDGKIYEATEDKEVQTQRMSQHGRVLKVRTSPCKYAQMHLVTGFKILAGPYEYKLDRLPIVRMTGRVTSITDRRIRFGLVRFMKDVVRLRNFWRSVNAEQLGYAPKAQWMATESAVEGREDTIRKAHMTRDPLLIFNDEAEFGRNVQRVDPPQIQMALVQESQMNTQDMKDVTGIHDASLGIKSNETSGRAIMARQREGDIASLTYYDNGNAAVLEAGDVINQLIAQIYDGTRIIRVIGEDESTKLQSVNDPMDPHSPDISSGKYDTISTAGASYTTRRVEAAQAMMETIQVYPELMQIAGDLVVESQDFAGAPELAERIKKTIPPQLLNEKERAGMEGGGQQGPDPQAMAEQQAQLQELLKKGQEQLQKLEVENATLKTKQQIEMSKLKIEEFNAETERLKVLSDMALREDASQMRMLEHEAQMENDEINRNVDMQKHERDATIKEKSASRPKPKSTE